MLSANASSASVTRVRCSASAISSCPVESAWPARETGAVAIQAPAAHGEDLPVRDLVEQVGTGRVDQAHAAADELERARVRKAATRGRRDVDDDAHARLGELLGRDPVEVGVVDDGDLVRPQALDEILRAAAESRRRGVLENARSRIGRIRALMWQPWNSDGFRRCRPARRGRERGEELLPAEHALELVAPLGVVEAVDHRLRRVARDLLDTEVRVRDARDLRQVRDRHHLHACREPLQRLGHVVGRLTADAGVDLVEDERLVAPRCAGTLTRGGCGARCACRNRRQRQGDARELATRRGVRDGCERAALG